MSSRRKKRIQAFAKEHGISYQAALQQLEKRRQRHEALKVAHVSELPTDHGPYKKARALLCEALSILENGDPDALERARWRVGDALQDLETRRSPPSKTEVAYRRGSHQTLAWVMYKLYDGADRFCAPEELDLAKIERLARQMRNEPKEIRGFLHELEKTAQQKGWCK